MKKILIYPYYDNPYQYLLYREIQRDPEITIAYLRSKKYGGYLLMFILPLMIWQKRIEGFTIFHIHWIAFNPQSSNYFLKLFAFLYTLAMIVFIKLLRFKLIWTVHDIVPHTALTVNDMLITRFLCNISNVKIVLSQQTIEELYAAHCNTKNCITIPHGNYIGYYPNTVLKKQARHVLRIDNKEYVFLFLGQLKMYKGVDDLLDAFSKIKPVNKDCTLIIAGKIYESSLRKIISQYRPLLQNKVRLYLRHITDDEVQYFMNAADTVVYPCKRITNSGSVLLALSFGKPVIYPAIGALKDLPENIGFSYPFPDREHLLLAMNQALRTSKKKQQTLEHTAYDYAQKISWELIAKQTVSVYKHI